MLVKIRQESLKHSAIKSVKRTGKLLLKAAFALGTPWDTPTGAPETQRRPNTAIRRMVAWRAAKFMVFQGRIGSKGKFLYWYCSMIL